MQDHKNDQGTGAQERLRELHLFTLRKRRLGGTLLLCAIRKGKLKPNSRKHKMQQRWVATTSSKWGKKILTCGWVNIGAGTQRSSGVSILGGVQTLSGEGPEQPGPTGFAWFRWSDWRLLEFLLNPPWACDSSSMALCQYLTSDKIPQPSEVHLRFIFKLYFFCFPFHFLISLPR